MHDCHGEEGLSAARRAALGGVARMSSRKRDGWARTAQPCLVAGRLRTITSLRELLCGSRRGLARSLRGSCLGGGSSLGLRFRRSRNLLGLRLRLTLLLARVTELFPLCVFQLLGVGVGRALLGDRKLRLLLRNARLQGLLRRLDGCLGCLGFGRGAADFAAGAGAAVCASAAVAPANASDTAKPMFLSSFDVLLSVTRCLTGTTTDRKPAEERTGQPGQGVSTIG